MAVVKVVQMEPFPDANGKMVNYKRLCIMGVLEGQIRTLEVKLEKSDLILAEILLASTESQPTVVKGSMNEDEKQAFQDSIEKKKTILDEDEPTGTGMFD